MDRLTLERHKKALESERDLLVGELKGFARLETKSGDWQAQYPQFEAVETGSHAAADEEADEVEEYEARLATENSLETRLMEVTRALERITLGGYGICLKCQKPIPPQRLQANPAAAYDMEHETDEP